MYGLLGRKLEHSFSPTLHSMLGNDNYQLFPTEELSSFFESVPFLGVNVTIPYKEAVIPFLDYLDPLAKEIGSVNTIVRKGNQLYGYNTDYYGLEALLSFYHISIENKNVLLLGNGAMAKTAMHLAKVHHASSVSKICRNPKEKNEYLFTEIDKVSNCDIIINTTPVGMYPNNQDRFLFSLDLFPTCRVVIDLIYNPLRTGLMQQAKQNGLLTCNGLYMLVMQAKRSHELFFNKQIPLSLSNKVYSNLKRKSSNLVLIGLPLSGKSLYGKKLSQRLHKKLVDTDIEIEKLAGCSIESIFETNGESYFRELEQQVVETVYQKNEIVIATGGGMIKNPFLMGLLSQNGVIIFLDKNPKNIMNLKIVGRPLLKDSKYILVLDKERRPLYQYYADITVRAEHGFEQNINEIEAKLDEYYSR